MAFALLYNAQDFSAIVAQVQNADGLALAQADKTMARRIWNGGLRDWQAAPVATGEHAEGSVEQVSLVDPNTGDPTGEVLTVDNRTRAIVVDSVVSKQQMIDLLLRMAAANPTAAFMHAIALDMRGSAVEPWP